MRTGGLGGSQTTPEEKEAVFIEILEGLKPGLSLFVEHPGLDTSEMQAIGHPGYENVADDRVGVTHIFTSQKVMDVIRRRQIKLVSYGDVLNVD